MALGLVAGVFAVSMVTLAWIFGGGVHGLVCMVSADREFWATEDDGGVQIREEEIAEPLEEVAS